MADTLVQEGMTFHTILRQKLDKNIERLHEIKKFSINTYSLFSQFSKNIFLTCKQLFQKLKNDEQEDENIIFMSKYLMDILDELTKKVDSIAKTIQNEVVDPMSEFFQNQTLTNKMLLRQSQEIIYSLESNNQFLKELSKNFDINAKNKSNQEQRQFNQIYQMQMEKCNQKWQNIKSQCSDILFKIDSYNSSRCTFTTKQQINLIKLINKLVQNQTIQQNLNEFEDMIVESTSLSQQIKDQIRQKIGRVSLLQDQPFKVDFFQNKSDTDESTKYSRQKRIIDDFVSIFTSKTNIKEQSKDFEQARGLILDKEEWIHYFLTKMQSSLHTQINLPIVKYRQITALIKYIFAHAAEVESQNEGLLYSILFISYRLRYGEDFLIKDIGKQEDFWKNTNVWFKIIQYVKKTKYSYKQVPVQTSQKPQKAYGLNDYIKFGKMVTKELWAIRGRNKHKNLKQLMQTSELKSQKLLLDARDYDIMCQVCYFMIKLELEEKFVFNFILQASERYHFSQQYIKKLVKIHSFNRITYNNKIGSTEIKRKKRLQKKYNSLSNFEQKLCLCVGKSLVFLSIKQDNIFDLRRVCKYWDQKLKDRIFKRYLIHESNLNQNIRLKLYRQICKPPYKEEVYRRMVQEMPQSTEHTQIIFLDAKRSLCWNESLRPQLMQVLGVYAFYHQDVGYLQGMNYLCENILKLTTNTFEVYSIFEYLMNNRYQNMYTGKFDGLKVKIYQMMRILQKQNPNLYNHFQAEKVQGQHFLLSWAITLWGEMSGQMCWILWDGFVLKGWKWWFKTCLWLLKNFEAEMLKMNFQQIMKCFSDLGNSFFCMNLNELGSFGIEKQKIKQEIQKIHIQSDILKDIQKQYEIKINTINQFLKKIEKLPK